MSKQQKLKERFLSNPTDFTYDELKQMLKSFGYTCDESGNGSRVRFYNEENNQVIKIHKPHPGNIVKSYVIKDVTVKLMEVGIL